MKRVLLAVAIIVSAAVGLGIAQAEDASRRSINGGGTGSVSHEATAPRISRSAASTILTAVVNRDASLDRGTGVVSSARAGCRGCYEVIFGQNVRDCTYVATIGSSAHEGIESTGEITTVGRAGEPQGVFLTTTDSAGRRVKRGFHLAVVC